jgi:hypothetical protein
MYTCWECDLNISVLFQSGYIIGKMHIKAKLFSIILKKLSNMEISYRSLSYSVLDSAALIIHV